MGFSRMFAAALAAALALPAVAQTRAADEARRAAEERRSTAAEEARRTAGQAGAPAAAPAPGQAQQAQHQLSQEQLQAIATVMARNDLSARVGDLAATRGSTPELQSLGRQIAEDHRRTQEELRRLLVERGVPDLSALPPAEEHEKLEGEFMKLAAVTGPEFDREVTEFLTRNEPRFVEELKRARDVTPGKDAQLKKFLDDAENTEENHLAASRRVKANRQARTPPAR
jgi:putative membrane protein